MKQFFKKYQLLICLIFTCVVVVASLFVAGFCGIKLGVSLGGGSQFEVIVPDSYDTKVCATEIKNILSKNGLTSDSFTVADNSFESGEEGGSSKRYIIVKVSNSNVSDEKELAVRTAISEKLGIEISRVSKIDNIVSSIRSKDILMLGLGVGLIAICLFVFGFIRYDLFAGLSFILAYLHNIILYLSMIIVTRIPLSLVSIAAIMILTVIMSALMISIYEKNKVESEAKLKEKETPSSRLNSCKAYAVKPYIFAFVAVLIFAVMMFFVSVTSTLFASISIIIALLISAYTGLLVGPNVYGYFLDIKEANLNAKLSRNDAVNKVIKNKIKKNQKSKA